MKLGVRSVILWTLLALFITSYAEQEGSYYEGVDYTNGVEMDSAQQPERDDSRIDVVTKDLQATQRVLMQCQATNREHEQNKHRMNELLESRRALAAELESVKENVESQRKEIKSLKSQIESMTGTTTALVDCQKERILLRTTIKQNQAECEAEQKRLLDERDQKNEQQAESLKAALQTAQATLANRSKDDFLLSYPQLERTVSKLWVVLTCLAIYGYETLQPVLTAAVTASKHSLHQCGMHRYFAIARGQTVGAAQKLLNRVEVRQSIIAMSDVYTVYIHRHMKRAAFLAEGYAMCIKPRIALGIGVSKRYFVRNRHLLRTRLAAAATQLNDITTNLLITPLKQRFPQIGSMIPASGFDRVLCGLYLIIVITPAAYATVYLVKQIYRLALNSIRHAVAMAFHHILLRPISLVRSLCFRCEQKLNLKGAVQKAAKKRRRRFVPAALATSEASSNKFDISPEREKRK